MNPFESFGGLKKRGETTFVTSPTKGRRIIIGVKVKLKQSVFL